MCGYASHGMPIRSTTTSVCVTTAAAYTGQPCRSNAQEGTADHLPSPLHVAWRPLPSHHHPHRALPVLLVRPRAIMQPSHVATPQPCPSSPACPRSAAHISGIPAADGAPLGCCRSKDTTAAWPFFTAHQACTCTQTDVRLGAGDKDATATWPFFTVGKACKHTRTLGWGLATKAMNKPVAFLHGVCV